MIYHSGSFLSIIHYSAISERLHIIHLLLQDEMPGSGKLRRDKVHFCRPFPLVLYIAIDTAKANRFSAERIS